MRYEAPECTVVVLATEDILTASMPGTNLPDQEF